MTIIKSNYELEKLIDQAEKNIENWNVYSLEEVYKTLTSNWSAKSKNPLCSK